MDIADIKTTKFTCTKCQNHDICVFGFKDDAEEFRCRKCNQSLIQGMGRDAYYAQVFDRRNERIKNERKAEKEAEKERLRKEAQDKKAMQRARA